MFDDTHLLSTLTLTGYTSPKMSTRARAALFLLSLPFPSPTPRTLLPMDVCESQGRTSRVCESHTLLMSSPKKCNFFVLHSDYCPQSENER